MKPAHFYLILFILALVFLSAGCPPPPANATEDLAKKSYVEKQAVKVSTEAVKKEAFSRELISNGTLTAKEKAVVPFAVNEQITDIKVNEGQQIEAGGLLATLDAFTLQKGRSCIQASNCHDTP